MVNQIYLILMFDISKILENYFHLATLNGHLEIVEWLLKYFAQVNLKDKNGATPLITGMELH